MFNERKILQKSTWLCLLIEAAGGLAKTEVLQLQEKAQLTQTALNLTENHFFVRDKEVTRYYQS